MEKNTLQHRGITILKPAHKDVRRLKRLEEAPSIHGNKLWGSSFLLIDYLHQNPLLPGSRVMELGCGWGLAGAYCASQQHAQVTGVDADPAVFPYFDLFAAHNNVEMEQRVARFENLRKKDLESVDVLIGADICFWDELGEVVYRLINRAVKAGVGQIIIADPQRSPFNTLADRCASKHHAELLEWSVTEPKPAQGALLVIENR